MCCRVKTQRNQGLPRMFVYIQLPRLGMETISMERQPAYVSVVLFIMTLIPERRILPRMVYAAIFYATQTLEIKLRSQVRLTLHKRSINLMFLNLSHTSCQGSHHLLVASFII